MLDLICPRGFKELDRLDVLMREIIDIDVEIKSHEQTLKDLHQQVVVGDEIVGRFSALRFCFSVLTSLRTTYWNSTKRKHKASWTIIIKRLVGKSMQRARHISYSSSRSMWASMNPWLSHSCLTMPQEVQHPNEAMPPVVEFLPRGLPAMSRSLH